MENTKVLPLIPVSRARYTKGEEWLNSLSHAAGAVFGVFVLVLGIVKTLATGKPFGIFASIVYGLCMILCYSISAVYHGLKQNKGKDVLRVLDHCAIYLLITGTYTGIFLMGVLPVAPIAAVAILVVEWSLAAMAITLTAVDMKKYQGISMACYIAMGWCLIVIPHIVISALTLSGFLWLLFGGVAYTLGSVLYGIGKKKRYIHGVFHIFCIIGAVFQFIAYINYCF